MKATIFKYFKKFLSKIAPSYDVGPRKGIAKGIVGSNAQRPILRSLQNNPLQRFNGTSNLKESHKSNIGINDVKKQTSINIFNQR